MTSTTTQPARARGGGRRGLPWWAWAALALVTVVALVAGAVAVFAGRGREVISAPPAPTSSPATGSTGAGQPANGCLGGRGDLDEAVLTAQREAPLTAEGAAAFTATLVRWAVAMPPTARHDVVGADLLTTDAADDARRFVATKDPEGTTSSADFSTGRYYVESVSETSAVVSWSVNGRGTDAGVPVNGVIGGTAHLQVVDGTWRFEDQSLERSLEDIERVGVPYVGGC